MKEGFSEEEAFKWKECRGADAEKSRGERGGELVALEEQEVLCGWSTVSDYMQC